MLSKTVLLALALFWFVRALQEGQQLDNEMNPYFNRFPLTEFSIYIFMSAMHVCVASL